MKLKQFISVPLNAQLVEAFSAAYLSPMYDDAVPAAQFHREVWELYCGPAPNVAVAAPRGHAKSTAFTHAYALANVAFRNEPHILITSATEDLAMSHLGDIAKELRDNEELREDFQINEFLVDQKSEIVVRCNDGYEFRIIARGSGQKLRGMKWHGRRPGLILGDDLEEDAQVENADQRLRFRRWVLRALMPLGRRGAKIRWHGTILAKDAMLNRIIKGNTEVDDPWVTRLYKAHKSYGDFSELLWPEYWTAATLRQKQKEFEKEVDSAGYAQEYLNDPRDDEGAYIQDAWFKPMMEYDYDAPKIICGAVDFAISKRDRANRTSITVGGKCLKNHLSIIGQHVGRWDGAEIIDEIFDVQKTYHPAIIWVENGHIWLSLKSQFQKEMMERDVWINFIEFTPISDKAARGRALQRRMKSGGIFWPFDAHWYYEMKEEILNFSPQSDAALDDQFDSASLLALGFESIANAEPEDFESEDEREFRDADPRVSGERDPITGY